VRTRLTSRASEDSTLTPWPASTRFYDQFQAVGPVADPRRPPAQRGQARGQLVVATVAGVADPLDVAERVQVRWRPNSVWNFGLVTDGQHHRGRGQQRVRVVPGARDQAVVVDEPDVDLIGVEQGFDLGRLALLQLESHRWVRAGELGEFRDQMAAQHGRVPGDADQPVRLGLLGQVELGGRDRGKNGPAMHGQPPPGRGQPDPAPVGLQQQDTGLAFQRGELMADR